MIHDVAPLHSLVDRLPRIEAAATPNVPALVHGKADPPHSTIRLQSPGRVPPIARVLSALLPLILCGCVRLHRSDGRVRGGGG